MGVWYASIEETIMKYTDCIFFLSLLLIFLFAILGTIIHADVNQTILLYMSIMIFMLYIKKK